MSTPRVYADFHNADSKGRLRLNSVGTTRDLARQHLRLHKGLSLVLYSDETEETELQVEGVVDFSDQERCWVAEIPWDRIRSIPITPIPAPDDKGSLAMALPNAPPTTHEQQPTRG